MKRTSADLVLRAGLAFAFLYPPLAALTDPTSWIGYFPHFLRQMTESAGVPDLVLLHGFGLIEISIALWLLSGWKIFWPSLIAALMLGAIVFFDFSDFDILFRDVAIGAMAIALAIRHLPNGVKME